MTRVLVGIFLIWTLSVPAEALDIAAPQVPKSGLERMPQNTDSFADALQELVTNSINLFGSEREAALQVCTDVFLSAMLFTLLPILTQRAHASVSIAGAVAIAALMFRHTNAMIAYASEAVWEICEYGKLLCPVLTTALAAQGAIASSTVLYTGTTAFISLLDMLVSRLLIPMLYIFLIFSVAYCALDEEFLKRMADTVKKLLSWLLKTLLIVFTSYMSITGVISGTTDAAALKAAKVTISSVVPVVGGILSDASESVLISISAMKNVAGTYGILAVLAVFLGPFLKIGAQYLFLKITAAICSLFASKNICMLTDDFASAMGLLLAMMASGCILVLVSTVCFIKGIGL